MPTAEKSYSIELHTECALEAECAGDLRLESPPKLRTSKIQKVRNWVLNELVMARLVQSVHLDALRRISVALGDPLKGKQGNAIDLADLAVAAIERSRNAAPSQLVEMSLAYEHAANIIESSCIEVFDGDFGTDSWFDLDQVDDMVVDVDDEVAYLESRRLLEHHPTNPRWVRILDEGEPLPEPAAETAGA